MRYHKYVKFCKSKIKKLTKILKMEAPSIAGNPQFGNFLENGDLFCPLYGKLAVRRNEA